MQQIRYGVFETNSSSTHSITMCMKSDYDAWQRGEVLFDQEADAFITREQALGIVAEGRWCNGVDPSTLTPDELDDALRENYIYNFNNFGSMYLEQYEDSFTTPSGETVVAFGEYGHD